MIDYKRDRDHTWDDIEAAIQELVWSMKFSASRRDWDIVWDRLPEQLVIHEIEFVTARCREMNKAAQLIFVYFLWETLNRDEANLRFGAAPYRVSPVAHRIQIAAVLAPLLEATRPFGGVGMKEMVADAIWKLPSCRPRAIPSDTLTERDLPWMRGEMLELIIEVIGYARRRSGDNKHCAWVGEHLEEVIGIFPHILERRSMDPALMRDLVRGAGNPLTEGVL